MVYETLSMCVTNASLVASKAAIYFAARHKPNTLLKIGCTFPIPQAATTRSAFHNGFRILQMFHFVSSRFPEDAECSRCSIGRVQSSPACKTFTPIDWPITDYGECI